MTRTGDPAGRPLRILVVNWLDRENPRSGGAETHLHQTFGRLAARGHEVVALVSGWPGAPSRATLDGIEVHRSGGRHTFSLTAPPYYRRHLMHRGFDVVVEDLNKVPVFSPLWARSRVVLLAHHLFGTTAFQAGPLPLALGTWLLERPIPWVFRHTPTVAVSESTKADLVSRGLTAERIAVIPNGIDVEHFSPRPEMRSERPTILFLGRLKRYKRVDLFVEAVGLLAAEGVDVELQVGGTGDQAEAIGALVDRLGLRDRVHMLGYLDEGRKLELLRMAWIHVLTSPKEGWGISNLEAAACGTPSVVSDSPGLRESVVDGQTGLLVPHGDVRSLADALARLVQDRELRTAMSAQARTFAEAFTWEASADAMEAFLTRLEARGGPR